MGAGVGAGADRRQRDHETDRGGGDVEHVVRGVDVEEVPALADGEEAVDEEDAVEAGEQPAVGAGPGQRAGQQQADDTDQDVGDVVQRVDHEQPDQHLVLRVVGEVVEPGHEEADDPDQQVDRAEDQREELRQRTGPGAGVVRRCGHGSS